MMRTARKAGLVGLIAWIGAACWLVCGTATARAAEPAKKAASPAPAASGVAKADEAPAPPTAAGGEAAAALPAKPVPKTYLDLAIAGGPVMIFLALCSIVFLAFLAERMVKTRRSRILPAPLLAALRGEGSLRPREQVEAVCAAHPSAAAAIIETALEHLTDPYDELSRSVNNTAQREAHALRKNMRVLSMVATVAPLLGLLGTVTGLIGAFREVSIQGLGQGQAYAAGIYEALANTAAGLMIAIPALLAYHWLMARIDHGMHQIDFLVTDLIDARRRAVRA